MQPDPTTPRSLSLNGLTDEERAGLLAMAAARQVQASSTPQAATPALKKAAPNRGNKRPRPGAADAPTPTTPASPAVEGTPSLRMASAHIGGTPISLSDADPDAPAEGNCPLVSTCLPRVTLLLQANPTQPPNPSRHQTLCSCPPLLPRTPCTHPLNPP